MTHVTHYELDDMEILSLYFHSFLLCCKITVLPSNEHYKGRLKKLSDLCIKSQNSIPLPCVAAFMILCLPNTT